MGVCHNLKYVTTFREVKIVVRNNRPRSIHIFPANYSLPQNIVYGFYSYIVSDMRQKTSVVSAASFIKHLILASENIMTKPNVKVMQK